ncbi:hypothetical protein Ga0061079_10698 [Apibacter mensalis]|uniref:Uncharacterized protein n=1 Tax=Apibacter mensalis TaxID=1586267 RepID=A0A0X3AQ12_9FLAO|nr:hypothetical protein Ga0061079_10698 [Apibacter mensalis]
MYLYFYLLIKKIFLYPDEKICRQYVRSGSKRSLKRVFAHTYNFSCEFGFNIRRYVYIGESNHY